MSSNEQNRAIPNSATVIRGGGIGAPPAEQPKKTDAAPPPKEPAPFADVKEGQSVRYCINRPYLAGEHVEIVDATLTAVHAETGTASLEYVVSSAVTVEKEDVLHSEGREPGTWHRA
jgi:hypothetical protein